ncbi:polymorphic toxin-type HINT domain-containing protein [Nonomuraea angiospora]|uniref:polymorphic toxin-type HINT domain-containing protein n=1 Tax=Nonomuraea angiospora TaxID=46172 RepID=UPI0037A7C55F
MLQLDALPVAADVTPVAPVLPEQQQGTAKNLPHQVGADATRSDVGPDGPAGPGNGKRPKGALPPEKRFELTDEPATGGLKQPPPLPQSDTPDAPKSDAPDTNEKPKGVGRPPMVKPAAWQIVPPPVKKAVTRVSGAAHTAFAVTAAAPTVSSVSSSGKLSSGIWTFSNTTPYFSAVVTEPSGNAVTLGVEIEHDPSVPAQGTGLIWSGQETSHSSSGTRVYSPFVPSGKLQDGWLIRWRVRGLSSGTAGAWSSWQAGKIDVSKPTVSSLGAYTGTLNSGLWTFSSTTPYFTALVNDPEGRSVLFKAEVEHDPSAGGQGSGLIWSGRDNVSFASGSRAYSLTVPSGKLQDGWLIRWRVRAEYGSVAGPWSEWQAGKIDTSKPTVSALSSSGVASGGMWWFSDATPYFTALVTDPDGRSMSVGAEVEHDPSAAGQGFGLIWSGQDNVSFPSGSRAYSLSVPSGKLQDGWQIRWRVRAVAGGVAGPWSDWQAGKIDLSKPTVSSLNAYAGTLNSGLWTFSSTTPYFTAVVSDPEDRSVNLRAEVEHDPSVPSQGSGQIWTDKDIVSFGSGTRAYSKTVPSGKLQDGWLIRWRVRAEYGSVVGPWSEWQTGRIDTSKPTVSELGGYTGTLSSGLWTFSSATPYFTAVVTDPEGRSVQLAAEVEHDPAAPAGQGSGRIWSGTDVTSFPSGSRAYSLSVPSGKLQDGWLIRWRVRAQYGSAAGPWSEWQTSKIDTNKPTVASLGAYAGTLGSSSWTFTSTTPYFTAVVTDPEDRRMLFTAEVEHDPAAPAGQGSGRIWSGTDVTSFTSGSSAYSLSVPSGRLQDGWLIRWRVRATADGTSGPWSEWQTGKIDLSKPSVASLGAYTGTLSSGLWTFSSTTPYFTAVVTDPEDRRMLFTAEVEHDPSVPSQGSGRIWSGTDVTSFTSGSSAYSLSVPSGRLQDGWLIRWRVRATADGTSGPWSQWQTGKIEVSKPAGTGLGALPATQGSGLWTFSTLTPSFYLKVTDPGGAASLLSAEVEHDPSVPGQGTGVIWSGTGTTSYPSGSNTWVQVPSAKLQDGWLVRWRVRSVTGRTTGNWTDWQTARVDIGKPAITAPGLTPGTQGDGSWTASSVTPWVYAKVTDPDSRASYLGVEIEHDPNAPAQGTGLIHSATATTSYASGSNAWIQVPTAKLQDGWLIRWRVRGRTTSGVNGPWTDWQSAKVDLKKGSVAGLGATPGTAESGVWTLASLTPNLYATVTDPENRNAYLRAEVEHDPSAPSQGSGQIWTARTSTAVAPGTRAYLQVPSAKLQDQWLIRWRVRAETGSVVGPWSEWVSAKVDLKRPSVEDLGMSPGTRGTASWTAGSLTPWLYASVTDPQNRRSYLGMEIEHDPAVPAQGTGQIYAGTGMTSYASGTRAWMVVPASKLKDGWQIRWRVRAVTTSSVTGPWSDWVSSKVSALPFKTFSPDNNSQVGTLTPVVSAHAQPLNEAEVKYWFQVCAGTQPNWTWCEASKEWSTAGSFKVPANKLKWGETYYWYVSATANGSTVTSSWRAFTPTPEQGTINALLTSGTNGREFNHVSGNYTHTTTDITVPVAGVPLSVTRTYNSLDPRTDQAFGAGWTTRWDMRLENEPQSATVLVTYPDGRQVRFAAKGDGTYAPPAGTHATMAKVDGGWRLMDKSSTSYWFDSEGRLTRLTDSRNRTQDLEYGADGKLAKATATGGRSLAFTWTGNHVTSVSTDPVDGSPITWTYQYDGDKLVKVCPPGAGTACTTYSYTDASRYRSITLDSNPVSYWRLGESGTATGTKVASATAWNMGTDDAKLTGPGGDLVAGVPGALGGSSDTAMRFKGAANSTYVSLPSATISGRGGSLAVEAWFKTTGSGTIIGYQNSATNTPTAFTPALYVGTDGKLRGQFYTGKPEPITSAAAVNDGNWHHVVLSGAENTQTLFLDGQVVGTLSGQIGGGDRNITHLDQWETRIGHGFASSAWPATTSSTAAFPFAGDIDEVALYGKPMGLGLVRTHYAARLAQPQLAKIVQPSGRVWAENAYAADGGRLTTHTDDNGGQWKLSAPNYTLESTTLRVAATTVTDPNGKTLVYADDPMRGYRTISRTDQLGHVTRYSYDVGGFLTKVVDRNGNGADLFWDVRGNMIAKKTCRDAKSCFTEYFDYYLKVDDLFDPRNDQVIVHRDGRSSSRDDERYATTWTFNSYGEEVAETTPPTSDFPQGRKTETVYTDGTEAAVGGGTTPAGLAKSETDYKGKATTYAYTASGDLAQVETPAGLITKFTHDAVGRVRTKTEISSANPDGVTSTFTYDAMNRVLTHKGPGIKNEVTGVTHTSQVTYTYDLDGNTLTETAADLTGGDPARTITYTYDGFGQVETMTGPENGKITYTWNGLGDRTSLVDELGNRYEFGYTPRGELATRTLKGWTGSPVAPQPATDVVLESYAYDPEGRMASHADAMGRKISYTYFADDSLSQVIADDVKLNGSTTPRDVILESNTYDPSGNVVRVDGGGGIERTDYEFDAADRLTSQTFDPEKLARKTAYVYDANDNVTKVTRTAAGTSRAETIGYAYNDDDLLVRQTVENGDQDVTISVKRDERGLIQERTDPRGAAAGAEAAAFTTHYRYDAAGRLAEVKAPEVKVETYGAAAKNERPTTRIGYDTAGNRTHEMDEAGDITTSVFDRLGRLVSVSQPQYQQPGGGTLTPKEIYAYNPMGQVTSFTDARGSTWTTEYDALGNRVRVTEPAVTGQPAGQWVYEYDLGGELLAAVDPTGARVQNTYDDLGRAITATVIERKPSLDAYITNLEYNDAGARTKEIGPLGRTTTWEVNADGEITKETDPAGNATTYEYDLAGRSTKVTNPLNNSTINEYDLAGRQIAVKETDSTGKELRTTTFGYDLAGNETSETSPEGHTIRSVYDATDLLTELTEPVSDGKTIKTTYGYDATGGLTRTTDGRGNTTWTTYNSLGLTEKTIEPATTAHPNEADRTWTFVYDAGGKMLAALQPGGVRIDNEYDQLGRLARENGSNAEAATPEWTFGYDRMGRSTTLGDYTLEYNDRGLLTKVAKAGKQTAAFTYDAYGNPTKQEDINGATVYGWDAADRLETLTEPVSGRTLTYGYDTADRLKTLTSVNPGGKQEFGYDDLDRITSHILQNAAGNQLSKIAYDWDKNDNLKSKTTEGLAGAGTNAYTYDQSDRMTSWIAPDGTKTTYEWDDSGNRTKVGDKTFAYDERNRLLSGNGTDYTYTPRGTLATETTGGVTKQLKFDAYDQLVSDGDATYTYDNLGRLNTRTQGGVEERFVYSGIENDIIAVTDQAGTVKARFGRDADGNLVGLEENGVRLGIMNDQHDDVVATFSGDAVVDSTAYNPFGEVVASVGTKRRLGYQGEYTDPVTGKVNMASRWYIPGTGGFASRDDWTINPYPSINLNRYTYASGNPLGYTDPSGNCPFCLPLLFMAVRVAAQAAIRTAAVRVVSRVIAKQAVKQVAKQSVKQVAKQSVKQVAKQGGKQAVKQGGKQAVKQGGKKVVKQAGKRSVKQVAKQAGKRTVKQVAKKAVKQVAKQAGKAAKKAVKQVGKAAKKVTKSVKQAGKQAGKAAKKVTKSAKKVVKKSGKAAKSVKKAAKSVKKAGKGSSKVKEAVVDTILDEAAVSIGMDWGVPADEWDVDISCRSLRSCVKDVVEEITEDVIDEVVDDIVDDIAPDVSNGVPGNCGGPSSFVPGTLVLMADGSRKPIEQIKAGDEVVAADPATGRVEPRQVTTLISSVGHKTLIDITLADGGAGNALTATETHPFWVPDQKRWVQAGSLQPGMWLQTSAGTFVQIEAVQRRSIEQRVHNLTVDEFHSYYVVAGHQAVLVHNDEPEFVRNQNLPQNAGPWKSYQQHVTGRAHEEVWRMDGRNTQVDGGPRPYVVEAKWTGRNDAAFESSPYNPSNYFDEKKVVDQARRLTDLNDRLGGKGVRYAVSNRAGADFFRAVFREWFPEEMDRGDLQVWHVPGDGMC